MTLLEQFYVLINDQCKVSFRLCVNQQGQLCFCRVLKILASLLSPTAFALGSVNFADYERAHVGLRWSNIWRVYSSSAVHFFS